MLFYGSGAPLVAPEFYFLEGAGKKDMTLCMIIHFFPIYHNRTSEHQSNCSKCEGRRAAPSARAGRRADGECRWQQKAAVPV